MADFDWPALRADWADKQQMSAAEFNVYAAVLNAHSASLAALYAALSAIVVPPAPPITFSTPVAMTGVTSTDRCYVARRLTGAFMRVASAPAGSALTVQVQTFDGTLWTTVATLTIADGSVTEVSASFSVNQAPGHLVRLNATSVGSMTAATGVIVDVMVA